MNFSFREKIHAPAFSLIELLVVVAVVSILAALVMPALSSAKQRAWSVSCQANLHQIGLTMRLFADENGEYYPESGGELPWGATNRVTGKFGWMEQIYSFTQNTNVYHCPGNVQLPLAEQGPFNYFNGCNAAYVEAGAYAPVKTTRIRFPSAFVLNGDTAGLQVFTDPTIISSATDPLAPLDADKNDSLQNCVGGPVNGSPFELWQIHNKGQNILFADGHSQWYKNFNPVEMTFGYSVMTNWVDYDGD
jgi:prepilin-type N-terminal cleavage/methylation domain-containing protein/prepilin-type processing-associated H-X9-DG protein